MAVKENEITKRTTDLPDTGYLRVVSEWGAAGVSQDLLKTLFTLPQSQIVGLVDALASLSTIPAIKSQMPFIKASGVLNGSGINAGVITSEATMNGAYNGFYTAVTPFALDDLNGGFVNNVLAFDNSVIGESTVTPSVRTMARQLIFASNGIFYREYSSLTWGTPMFLGGTTSNFAFSYADLAEFASQNKLTPGTLYKITDHGNDNGIIIQAATASLFKSDGIRLGLVPKYPNAGTFETNAWKGAWRPTGISYSTNDYVHYCGRVWKKNSTAGNGTPTDWILNVTYWDLVAVSSGAFYSSMVFGCTYDFANDYISKQWNSKDLIFGEQSASDGFLVEYNDWNLGDNVYSNELARCYSNKIDTIGYIHHCKGGGQMFSNDLNGGDYAGFIGLFIDSPCFVRNNSCTDAIIQGTLMSGNNIENQTFTASTELRLDKGKVISQLTVNSGTFTVPPGAYAAMTIASGMDPNITRDNGIYTTIPFYAIPTYTGWHRIKLNMMFVSTTGMLEAQVYVGSTLQVGVYDRQDFVGEATYRLLIDAPIDLTAGDVVTIKFKHSDGVTNTYPHINSTFSLEYDN